MNKDEVLKLATLARVEIAPAEAESLSHEFDTILSYVGEVKAVGAEMKPQTKENTPLRNILREDENAHESGIYTEAILKGAPSREGQYIKVKKIL